MDGADTTHHSRMCDYQSLGDLMALGIIGGPRAGLSAVSGAHGQN